MRRTALGVLLATTACGPRTTSPIVAPHEEAGLASVPAHAEAHPDAEAAPPGDATPPTRRISDDVVVERFADPTRHATLVSALGGLDDLVRARGRSLGVAGLVVGVVVDDELVGSSYGLADVAAGRPVDLDTVFRIGSITKTFTAMAILELRDQGRLDLDDPVQAHVPELASLVYPTTDAPLVTLRHLLSHTSGLPREAPYQTDILAAPVPQDDLLGSIDGLPLDFVPGTDYRYSNLGFQLLGLALTRVSGTSYRELVAETILRPLGMTSAAWERGHVDPDRLARSHRSGPTPGSFEEDPSYVHAGATESAGALYLSARDFAEYVKWQLGAWPPRSAPEAGIPARASIREAQAPGRVVDFQILDEDPHDHFEMIGHAVFVGLGWHGARGCNHRHVVSHGGAIEHHRAHAVLLPPEGVGVFAFTNTAVDLGPLMSEILETLRRSGALRSRERVATKAPVLDGALSRWLAVYDTWNEPDYLDMLSDRHKAGVPIDTERRELAHYRRLHGHCDAHEIVSYEGPDHAVYELTCERGTLLLDLGIDPTTGEIERFWGRSLRVPEAAGTRAAAQAAIALLNRRGGRPSDYPNVFEVRGPEDRVSFREFAERHYDRSGRCHLGDALEQTFDGTEAFALRCQRGPTSRLEVRLSASSRKIGAWRLRPETPSVCPLSSSERR